MRIAAWLLLTLGTFWGGSARAWEPLRSANSDVESGNAAFARKQYAEAVREYDRAVRALPSEPRVHLNRGLALAAKGDFDGARVSLKQAAIDDAPAAVRSSAHYALGHAAFAEGERLAKEGKHGPAQAAFRQATESFSKSLRLAPGSRDAAWNLQLAQRRVRDEEEKAKQEQKQKQSDDKQNSQQKSDEQKKPEEQKQEKEGSKPESSDADPKQPPKQEPPKQDQSAGSKPKQDQQQQQPGGQQAPKPGQAMPEDARRVLDALRDSEQNMQRYRAAVRAAEERRRPEKDW